MGLLFGFAGAFAPSRSGRAVVADALFEAMTRTGEHAGRVVRVVQAPARRAPNVTANWIVGDPDSLTAAADVLNECDLVIFQHDFASFGGADGEDALHLLTQLRVPCIVVLHAVLREPSAHQRHLLEAAANRAASVVVMTEAARVLLATSYAIDAAKVSIIAHGAPDVQAASSIMPVFRGGERTILTWGLLAPGKGIEWALQAMALLHDVRPAPRYIVAGATRPSELRSAGEAYRNGLSAEIRRLGLGAAVRIDGRHRTEAELTELIATADVVLLPYDRAEHHTSGVLVRAVAAGKPVVATTSPHALELLSGGAGIVVAPCDPDAMAAALREVLTRDDVAVRMSRAARAAAPQLRWSAIAQQYLRLAERLTTAPSVA